MSTSAAPLYRVECGPDDMPDSEYESVGGGPFAAFGLRDAGAFQAKADMVHVILNTVAGYGLSETQAAAVLGISKREYRRLAEGQTLSDEYEVFMGYLKKLGMAITVRIMKPDRPMAPRERKECRVMVHVAKPPKGKRRAATSS
jgi:predicted XRE-type DNA-binding protein